MTCASLITTNTLGAVVKVSVKELRYNGMRYIQVEKSYAIKGRR